MPFVSSLSCDDLVLDDGDISLVSVEANLVTQREVGALAVPEWQRELVVGLGPLVDLSILHGDDGRILCIKPRSLDISRALWVINLVNFTAKTGSDLYALLVHGSWSTETSLDSLRVLEGVLLLCCTKLSLIPIRITSGRLPVSFIMIRIVLVNDGAKT